MDTQPHNFEHILQPFGKNYDPDATYTIYTISFRNQMLNETISVD